MSKLISVKMDDEVFSAAERNIKRAHTNRNAYIVQAVRLMNRMQERRLLGVNLAREAQALYGDTRRIVKEFDALQSEGLE